ncbi:hypothetical protein [Mesoplasma tabanidae]|uniref:Uncharacterized protein n=1 Tax=Mesoplasma tabanidae TaxID=219745 RepID=A0A2K8P521_9MOLU|nr:hypothetical protein [Mesoplasma tabanidae]ATZ21851.1 hypothetical protein MTABA_v1c06590 [Mesoplasma tabanidae]
MFYLFSKSILVEIGFKDQIYYIGNEKFNSIPDYLLNNCYSSGNWNRALKYKTAINEVDKKYFMLDVEVYWNLTSKKIELISKIFFFSEIINSKHFRETFLNTLLTHYFKHTLKILKPKEINKNFIKVYKPEISKDNLRINNFDNFLVLNEEISFKNKKFKSINKVEGKDAFSWNVNKLNQIVYSFSHEILEKDTLLKNTDFIDLNNSLFYINSLSKLNKNLVLEFCVYDKKTRDKLMQKMIKQIKMSNDSLANWHLFNLTKDIKYLKIELSKISENIISPEEYLKQVYSKLKRNYEKELLNL